ncbi:MAG TPA: hypothetical protein VGK74_10590 [Symbiobacteriaceae bacterium]
MTGLRFDPGAAFSYVNITFVEMGTSINTESEIWRKLEGTLGTRLVATHFML